MVLGIPGAFVKISKTALSLFTGMHLQQRNVKVVSKTFAVKIMSKIVFAKHLHNV